MKVLIVGGGGREHALCWKIAQSRKVNQIFVAPGNAGTEMEPKTRNIPIAADDIPALLQFASENSIDLTLVGPEAPLVAGIVDEFEESRLACFGPTRGAAQLEGSKSFCKDFLMRHNIPTAEYRVFTETEPACEYVRTKGTPIVVKADGLAAGKGVCVARTQAQAILAIKEILDSKAFGEAGRCLVIEEYLHGEEASFIVIADGKKAIPFATSQDHKARDNGDEGPNTGGMGAYSPAPVVTQTIHNHIMATIIQPTLDGMANEGSPYTGFLYAGLMITPDNNAKVLEYNCRFGDPETQPIMMRLKSDLVELCRAARMRRLDEVSLEWDQRPALGVVMAAGGYPGNYRKNDEIIGLPIQQDDNKKIFHAGTKRQNGKVVTAGGRVVCACALADSIATAQREAYEIVRSIQWKNAYYRTDIGYRAF